MEDYSGRRKIKRATKAEVDGCGKTGPEGKTDTRMRKQEQGQKTMEETHNIMNVNGLLSSLIFIILFV